MSLRITPSAKSMFQRLGDAPPVAPNTAGVASQDASAKEPTAKPITARLESVVEGECPYCHGQMTRSSVEAGEVWMCVKDRHVVPIRDSQ